MVYVTGVFSWRFPCQLNIHKLDKSTVVAWCIFRKYHNSCKHLLPDVMYFPNGETISINTIMTVPR